MTQPTKTEDIVNKIFNAMLTAKNTGQITMTIYELEKLITTYQREQRVDHVHCPETNSPCGIEGKHRCCLCGEEQSKLQNPLGLSLAIADLVKNEEIHEKIMFLLYREIEATKNEKAEQYGVEELKEEIRNFVYTRPATVEEARADWHNAEQLIDKIITQTTTKAVEEERKRVAVLCYRFPNSSDLYYHLFNEQMEYPPKNIPDLKDRLKKHNK